MRHEMLTQRALFCHHVNIKRGTLSQHFMTHVVPPLGFDHESHPEGGAYDHTIIRLYSISGGARWEI